jgi:curved DNA-binding protein CbpA
MQLDQGLFKFDFNDHYAVLGLPIDADSKMVRKRYLQIARKLHPDSMAGSSSESIQKASEMLSKWVNPAYETLSQDKANSEYQLVLKLRGQTLHQSNVPPSVDTPSAQKLLQTSQVEGDYHQAVKTLASQQYEQFDNLEATIGQLSELNLIYLYRTTTGETSTPSKASTSASSSTTRARPTASQTTEPPPPPRRVRDTILDSYIKRAQDFDRNKDSGRAILELREALKTYPDSADCHSYLASLYLKAGQSTMAKIHAKRALDISPDDQQAKAVQARVERASGGGKSTEGAKGSKGKAGSKGGGFFGLFGGKKK